MIYFNIGDYTHDVDEPPKGSPVSCFNNWPSTSKVVGDGTVNTVTKTTTNVIYCAGFESLGQKES